MCPGSTSRRRSRLGACVSTTSRSPRAAAARICPEGPITVAGTGCASESSTARAPDCSTVYVVPSRSGRSPAVHAASAAHASAARNARGVALGRFALAIEVTLALWRAPAPEDILMRRRSRRDGSVAIPGLVMRHVCVATTVATVALAGCKGTEPFVPVATTVRVKPSVLNFTELGATQTLVAVVLDQRRGTMKRATGAGSSDNGGVGGG